MQAQLTACGPIVLTVTYCGVLPQQAHRKLQPSPRCSTPNPLPRFRQGKENKRPSNPPKQRKDAKPNYAALLRVWTACDHTFALRPTCANMRCGHTCAAANMHAHAWMRACVRVRMHVQACASKHVYACVQASLNASAKLPSQAGAAM
eukprot:1161543-Pelagomonas_calceolata.AAC.4